MDTWWQVISVMLASVLGSSGLWAYLSHRDKTKQATTRLLMGLAYDRITHVGMSYIERGWISKDELEDFRKYFFEPYKELGGNGVAEKFMEEINKLPLKSHTKYMEIVRTVQRRQEEADGAERYENAHARSSGEQ